MTIEEVMALVISLEVEAQCYGEDDNASVEAVNRARAAVRAALLALVAQARDEALEEAAVICNALRFHGGTITNPTKQECVTAIRARIAARKGGNHD